MQPWGDTSFAEHCSVHCCTVPHLTRYYDVNISQQREKNYRKIRFTTQTTVMIISGFRYTQDTLYYLIAIIMNFWNLPNSWYFQESKTFWKLDPFPTLGFWSVTPSVLVNTYQCFRENTLPVSSMLTTEVVMFFRNVSIKQSTQKATLTMLWDDHM
jgi:hypothetical protein